MGERFAASTFADFYNIEEIHRSQTGAVYAAHFKYDKRRYILKERKLPELGRSKDIMNEVTLMLQLCHPNVVRCEGFFRDMQRHSLFIILEYCDGGDLFALLKKYKQSHRSLSEAHIWHIFYQLCDALKHLHENGIVHRDIKTMNVMCVNNGQVVKLADLGVSRQLSDETLMLSTFYGTPLYLSPELVENKPYNEKTDIWSLGIILYEMASLTTPFSGKTLMELGKQVMAGKFEPVPSGYSQHLTKCIRWMLNADMTLRPNIVQLLKYVDQRRNPSFNVCGCEEPLGLQLGVAENDLGGTDAADEFQIKDIARRSKNKIDVSGSNVAAQGKATPIAEPSPPTYSMPSSSHPSPRAQQQPQPFSLLLPLAPAPPAAPAHAAAVVTTTAKEADPSTSLSESCSAAQKRAELESRFGEKLHISMPKRPSPLDQPPIAFAASVGPGFGALFEDREGKNKRVAGVGGWKADGSDMPSIEACKDGLNTNSEHGKVLSSRRRAAQPAFPEVDVISGAAVDHQARSLRSLARRGVADSREESKPEEAKELCKLQVDAAAPSELRLGPPKTVTMKVTDFVKIDQQRLGTALRRESCCLRKLLQARDFLSNPNKASPIKAVESAAEASRNHEGKNDRVRRKLRPKETKKMEDSEVDSQVRLVQRRIKLMEQALDSGVVDANSEEW